MQKNERNLSFQMKVVQICRSYEVAGYYALEILIQENMIE